MYVLDPGFQFWVTHFSAIVFDLSLLVLSTKSEKQKEFKTGLCNLIDFSMNYPKIKLSASTRLLDISFPYTVPNCIFRSLLRSSHLWALSLQCYQKF